MTKKQEEKGQAWADNKVHEWLCAITTCSTMERRAVVAALKKVLKEK